MANPSSIDIWNEACMYGSVAFMKLLNTTFMRVFVRRIPPKEPGLMNGAKVGGGIP
jgi:hypothetical protein